MNGSFRVLACLVSVVFVAACSSSSTGSSLTGINPLAPDLSASAAPAHALQLTAVAGEGTGIVNVTATARSGEFVANTQDAVHVRGVTPDTLLYVRVAADVGLPNGEQSDGICQRAALGQFMPLALYPGGPAATIETSRGGAGTVHVVFGATNPFISNGSRLDLQFRIVNALPPAVPTIDLRTECFTVEIK
jgi:hypothetical protein